MFQELVASIVLARQQVFHADGRRGHEVLARVRFADVRDGQFAEFIPVAQAMFAVDLRIVAVIQRILWQFNQRDPGHVCGWARWKPI